jgi:hypothetical protein
MSLDTYRASSAYTITLASLASSSGLTVGRCSTSKSNASNKDEHLGVSGVITIGGSASVGLIEVWAFAQRRDGTWPELFTGAYSGSDGAFTVQGRQILRAGAYLVAGMQTVAGSNVAYPFRIVDLARLFGFAPAEHALFVVHNTGVNLNSTAGNHSIDLLAARY